MDVLSFCIIVLVGLGVGILAGAFGIGGGGIIVPLLHLVFGLPMINATSTSLLTIAPTAISGSIKHLRQKTAKLKVGILMGISGAVAAVGSSLLSVYLPSIVITLLTVIVIVFSVAMMLRNMYLQKSQELDNNPAAATPKNKSLFLSIIIGLIGGTIAGMVGVGGGFIIVPFGIAYLGFSMKEASGTSLISIAIIALPGLITHAFLGHIWWIHGLAVIIGTIPGAQLGAWLISILPERQMRLAYCILLLLCGFLLLIEPLYAS
jgi:uncharacterized membrane protein YfcA